MATSKDPWFLLDEIHTPSQKNNDAMNVKATDFIYREFYSF